MTSSTTKLQAMQLHGFQSDNLAYYCASTLRVLARDHVSEHLQVIGMSMDWDHVFVALAGNQQDKQLIYLCSDNILRLLTALHHQSPYYANVTHVILQDRFTTIMLTGSRDLICLKEVKDDWELSVITRNITTVASCHVTGENDDMRFALIDNGKLVFLTGDHVIYQSPGLQNVVSEVSCGGNHLLLLDTRGHVYSCGHGNRGQLGHSDTVNRYHPTIIELTVVMTIIKISAGGWHSAMLSSCHDVYTNGWNCDGQLGHNLDVAMVTQPTLVTIDDDSVEFRLIACGSRHTVAISNNNDVYSWGWNKYKQLAPWQRFHHLIKYVKCGPWNTLYLTT